MADSARLQILKEVERLLNTVEGIKYVTRNINDVLSLPNYPAAIVQAGDEDRPDTNINEIINVDWLIGIELWVKAESNLGNAQEDFLAKVEYLFAQNRKLLNKVHFLDQDGARQWIPINEALTITGVMLTYLAKFKRARGDPYTLA